MFCFEESGNLEEHILSIIKTNENEETHLLDSIIELLESYKQSTPKEDFIKFVLTHMDNNPYISRDTQNNIYVELLIYGYKDLLRQTILNSYSMYSLFTRHIDSLYTAYSLKHLDAELEINSLSNIFFQLTELNKHENYIKLKHLLYNANIIKKLADQ